MTPENEPPTLQPPQAHERKSFNVRLIGLYDIVIRIGWIFKTESVIMPAFLDQVAGAGWLRGLLPVVNRFGQSVPPAIYAPRLRHMSLKKWSLAVWTAAMGCVFLALSAVWWHFGASPPSWMASAFLTLYGLFSASHGINQLSHGTVLGKLVAPGERGQLMAWSLPIGASLAVVGAWLLMGKWLAAADEGFTYIFGFTGVCFLIAACFATALREPPDAPRAVAATSVGRFHMFALLKEDVNFRRFGYVAFLSSMTVILFPHYQALARERLGLAHENLMIWVVVQNLAVAVFGFFVGRIVHRWGERLAVRGTIFGTALAPLAAVVMATLDPAVARQWYWTVFIFIGMSPISQKTMLGYALEASPQSEHPRYLSTLSMCQAIPFLMSPGVGWLTDRIGFEAVFLTGSVVLMIAGVITWRIEEPRERHHMQPKPDPPALG